MAYERVAGVRSARAAGLMADATGTLAPFPAPQVAFLPDTDEGLADDGRPGAPSSAGRVSAWSESQSNDPASQRTTPVDPEATGAPLSVTTDGVTTTGDSPSPGVARPGESQPELEEGERPNGLSLRGVRQRVAVPLGAAVGAPTIGALAGVGIAMADSDMAGVALATAAVGVGVGIAGGLSTWRRLRIEVDEPAEDLRHAAVRIGAGQPVAPTPEPPRGVLAPVAVALDRAGGSVARRTERLMRQAAWGESSRMIFEALEFAEDEGEAYAVAANALALTDEQRPMELLISQRGVPGLHVVAENPHVESPGCPVESTDACVAIRRGQVLVTDSSESINACPKLRGRDSGPCSAVCVPVGVAGQTVGVIHATGPDRVAPQVELVDRLSGLARQVGTRLGSLRALERSREEAATDGLTGLPNRRVLEAQLEQLLESEVEFVAVLGDLDRFKALNDTYGHEAGDRALQLFARVMQENVRGHDLVARVGGEEFVVVYPDMSVLRSIEAIERLRTALSSAVAVSGVQPFTCAYGVTHSSVGSSVLEILRVADAGLLRAKELGGDQVVYADEALAAEVFGNGEPVPASPVGARR